MAKDPEIERVRTRRYHAKAKALGIRRLQSFVLESDLPEIHRLLKPFVKAAKEVMENGGHQLDLLNPDK